MQNDAWPASVSQVTSSPDWDVSSGSRYSSAQKDVLSIKGDWQGTSWMNKNMQRYHDTYRHVLWVLKQWMPQVMCMRNSGHLLKTESPENLVWQLTEPIMEKIFSYIWQSISVSHIRKSSYPDSSNGRYEVVGVYISISGKGKETVLESLENDKTMERASLKLWKVCTQVLLQSTPQPPSKQNTVKPPKGTQWEKKRGACSAYRHGLKAQGAVRPEGCAARDWQVWAGTWSESTLQSTWSPSSLTVPGG